MKKESNLGQKFETNKDLHSAEATIPKGTVFKINEILEDGDYKVYFEKCIYDQWFKNQCTELNCEPNNEDGNV